MARRACRAAGNADDAPTECGPFLEKRRIVDEPGFDRAADALSTASPVHALSLVASKILERAPGAYFCNCTPLLGYCPTPRRFCSIGILMRLISSKQWDPARTMISQPVAFFGYGPTLTGVSDVQNLVLGFASHSGQLSIGAGLPQKLRRVREIARITAGP